MKFRNNIAAFGWGFSAFFLAGCFAFTYILIRDGSSNIQVYPPDIVDVYPRWFMPVVLAIFWLAAYGSARYLASKPCIFVEVLPNKSVSIIRRYPFKTEVQIIEAAMLEAAQVVESVDSDSEPYFNARIIMPNGVAVDIAEGHQREMCETVCARFNAATDIHSISENSGQE